MFAPEIHFQFWGNYYLENTATSYYGKAKVILGQNEVLLENNGNLQKINLPLRFIPETQESCFFELQDVTIGINFHWERKENQRFSGQLIIIKENHHLTAINELPVEDYLKSVISSEMSAKAGEELLKAHAVISRSWLIAQTEKSLRMKAQHKQVSCHESDNKRIKWYDREDHIHYDVCADDHCQRYQGITRASTDQVSRAIDATFGQVLMFQDNICDARYSKCCGGIAELFENTWEEVPHPYLKAIVDNHRSPEGFEPVADTQENAQKWILGQPEAFCNTKDAEILSQVLNDYDQETPDFFRWETKLSQEEVCRLLKEKVNVEVGDVLDIVPLQRGPSGRIITLRIEGTKMHFMIGKELEIRKAFSPSHLYSSAFVVEKIQGENQIPSGFVLHGAGWGHGVGLCQIGAAVMGAKGYSFRQILQHYFPGAELQNKY